MSFEVRMSVRMSFEVRMSVRMSFEVRMSVRMSFEVRMSVRCPLKLGREPKRCHDTLPRYAHGYIAKYYPHTQASRVK